MKLKKILTLTLFSAFLALSLTACGGSDEETSTAEGTAADPIVVKLGVVGSIYEDLWAPAK